MSLCKISLKELKDEDSFTKVDFRGCNFLTNTYLSNKTFESCNFKNCNLTEANLYMAELSNSDLTDANLTNTLLKDIRFTDSDLTGANLTGAYATGAFFNNTVLTGTDFTGADLTKVSFLDSVLTGADFTGADLTKASLTEASFIKSLLIGSNLTKSYLDDANLTDANLTNANLTNAYVVNANLEGANLTNANLTETNLKGAKLTKANLTGANLTGANLTGADLTGADLTGADLTDADLSGADLASANLTNSNLTGSNLMYTRLDNVNFSNIKSSGQSQIREQILDQDKYKSKKVARVLENNKPSSKITNDGYNPTTNGYQNVSEWLKNKNNLVFIIDGKPLCLQRDLFRLDSIQMNYILYPCDISERKYVKTVSKNELSFIDLGKFNLKENTVINYKNFLGAINESKNQVFLINRMNPSSKTTLFNEEAIININIFNKVLLEYSKNTIYQDITDHLIHGKSLTDEGMKHISYIDQCFMEYAQVTTDNDMIVYRGMKKPYGIEKGESMVILNYISTTANKNPNVINVFQDQNYFSYGHTKHLKPKTMPQHINNCCVYEIKIEKGIPFIDMRYSTESENEREILLPRNLLITCTGGYVSTNPEMYITTMVIKKTTKNQFKSIKRKQCSEFIEATISPFDITIIERRNKHTTTRKNKKTVVKSKKTARKSRL
jgi:uncharacterized protein YjbI with pentapeptide repeats